MADVAVLRVHLLGAFRVQIDDRLVPETAWRSARASALVKLLALAPQHRLHREQVAEAFWPSLGSEAQANNFNVAVSRARQALTSVGAPPGAFVVRRGDSLVLGPPEAVWVDVDAFEAAAADAGRRGEPGALRAALALYPGDLLVADPYEEWAESRRTALRATMLALLARLGQAHEERGDIDDAIEAYRRLIAVEPAHEEVSAALMRLYAGQGRRSLALTEYDRLADALRRDLDATPARATTDLAAAIRDGHLPRFAEPATPPQPTARVVPPPADSLPEPLDELVGRERERAEVAQLLASCRLVTLTGPGGIGKTRLAIAVAHAVRATSPDGAVFVDLAPIRDPALVAVAILQAFDLRDSGGQSPVDALVAHLRDKSVLLVLDNFEQVAEAAPAARTLLAHAPRLKVLATSRMALRVSGEREYPVPPLAVPAAADTPHDPAVAEAASVTLFLTRALGVKPGFRATSDNLPAIAEVCRRLERLPLAIELAAARVKVLTPEAMLTRLGRPLALLVGGQRDLPERQQTIRQTIAWSHDLLSPPEQRLFRRLAVFVGGWTLEAAEDVVTWDGPSGDSEQALGVDVLDGLASLVDKSLVVQHDVADGMRFGMLETIREFGLERLGESGDEARVRDRHAAHFVDFAERARSHIEAADQASWLDRQEREEGNLRAALDWAIECGNAELGLRLVTALQMYWFIRGRIGEGCDRSLAIVRLPGSAAFPALRADALNGVGMLARDGDVALAAWASGESRAIAQHIGDRKREADALANLGYLALQRGDSTEANDLFVACLDINRALGNAQGLADAVSFLALTAYYRDDINTARRLNEESLAIWESLDDHQGVVWARTRLASVLVRQREHQRALAELVASLATARELDFRWGLSWSFDGLARLAADRGMVRVAASLADAAASVREDAGLRLSPAEEAEVRELRRSLSSKLGANAPEMTAADSWQTPDALVRAIHDCVAGDPA